MVSTLLAPEGKPAAGFERFIVIVSKASLATRKLGDELASFNPTVAIKEILLGLNVTPWLEYWSEINVPVK